MFIGLLGVGKLLLINVLVKDDVLLIGEVCEKDSKGCYMMMWWEFVIMLLGVLVIDMFGMCEL